MGTLDPEPMPLTEAQQVEITGEVARRARLLRNIGLYTVAALVLSLVARMPIWALVPLTALEVTVFVLAARHYRRIIAAVTAAGWRGPGAP